MPRSFNITSATAEVPLDRGRGEATFTVSNISTSPVRGRARLVPLGGTQPTWLAVDGEPERDFKTNDTQQVVVRIAVPGGTPANRHSFRLDMIAVANPDEDYSEGPAVAFEVRPSNQPSRPLPVWVFLVAAAVLLIGAIAVWWVSMPSPTPPEGTAVAGLKADFAAAPESGTGPLPVQFADKSEGDVTAWDWSFGDSSSSIEKDPAHTYEKLGQFKITLRVRDSRGGERTLSRDNFIRVNLARPKPLAPATHPIPPELIIPHTGGGIHLTTKVRFKWEVVPLAIGYRLEIQGKALPTATWQGLPIRDATASQTTDVVELGPVRDWRWRLHARSDTAGIPDTVSDWLEFGGS